MLIPKNLFASMEAAQRLMNNPNIQRIQLAMNNVQKLQETINSSAFQSVNLINQQMSFANLTNLNILAKQINFPDIHRQFESISSNLKILSEVYLKNHNYWNNVINSAIDAYNSTQEEEFEVVIENIPVSIIKPTIKEIVMFYVEQGINIEIAFRLAISSYIFIKIYPVIFMINSEELVIFLNQFSKYIYKCGSSVLKLSIQKYYEFQDPEEFAKFLVDQGTSALFGFIIRILK